MKIIPDFLTIIRGPKPINKTVIIEHGSPKKIPNAAIARATAKTVKVGSVDDLALLEQIVGADPRMALISGYAAGTEPGDEYEIVSENELKRLAPGYRSGFVDVNGKKTTARTKRNFSPSTWINFDRDIDPDCPDHFNDLSDEEYVDKLAAIVPGLDRAGHVIVPSTSGRVRFHGRPLGSGGARYWFQCRQEQPEDLGQQLLFGAIENGLAYLVKSKSDASLIRTIFDAAVFSRERICFDGSPVIRGEGLTLDPPMCEIREGYRLNLDRVKRYTIGERVALQRDVRGIPALTEVQTTLDGGLSWKDECGRIVTETVTRAGSIWQTVEGQLQLDTPVEVKDGVITPRSFFAMGITKLRAQYPFRQNADGWSAILRMEGGLPTLFDVVSNTKHALSRNDRHELLFGGK